jgi:hypothetical protein
LLATALSRLSIRLRARSKPAAAEEGGEPTADAEDVVAVAEAAEGFLTSKPPDAVPALLAYEGWRRPERVLLGGDAGAEAAPALPALSRPEPAEAAAYEWVAAACASGRA